MSWSRMSEGEVDPALDLVDTIVVGATEDHAITEGNAFS